MVFGGAVMVSGAVACSTESAVPLYGAPVPTSSATDTPTAVPLYGAPAPDAGPNDTDWPSYNNTVDGQRYSALEQITTANVAGLKEVCRLQIDDSGTFQPGIIAIDGTLYLTNAHDTLAVDASNCKLRWRHSYRPDQQEVFQVNRGVAYANGKLFRGTPDARLLALEPGAWSVAAAPALRVDLQ